jgi:ferredoxin-NADP reductase
MLSEVLAAAGASPAVFACGPTPLVEVVATNLVALGLAPSQVRTERFGPSGG